MEKTQKESILINTRDAELLLEDFSDEDAGTVFKALLAYANRGEAFETEDKSLRVLFKAIKANVDRNNERYEDTCEKRKKAIAKRWEKKGKAKKQTENQKVEESEEAEAIQMYTNDTNVYKRIQKIQMYTNDTDSDSERDSDEPNGSVNIEPNGSKQKQSFCEEEAAAEACAREGEEPPSAGKPAGNGAAVKPEGEPIDFERVRRLWNETVEKAGAKMPKLSRMTDRRMALVRARARDSGADSVYRAIEAAAHSEFLNHGSRTGKAATFEWLFEQEHFTKVLEGYYDNAKEQPPETPGRQARGGRGQQASTKGYREELERNNRQTEAEREKRRKTADFYAVLAEYGVKPWESTPYKDLFEAGLTTDRLRAELAKRVRNEKPRANGDDEKKQG